MRIVGRAFECSKKPVEDSFNVPEAPPFIDEETFEATERLAEAGKISLQDFEKMTVADLKALAREKGIDLGSTKTKADIIATIAAAMSADDVPEAE